MFAKTYQDKQFVKCFEQKITRGKNKGQNQRSKNSKKLYETKLLQKAGWRWGGS